MARSSGEIGVFAMLKRKIRNSVRQPVIGPLLGNRFVSVSVFLFSAIQLIIVRLHLPGWPCVFHDATGIPCPGCGLSRAMVALLQGDLESMVRLHLFALPALIATGLIGIAWILPAQTRHALARFIERMEINTGLTAGLGFLLVIYWLCRLVFMSATLYGL